MKRSRFGSSLLALAMAGALALTGCGTDSGKQDPTGDQSSSSQSTETNKPTETAKSTDSPKPVEATTGIILTNGGEPQNPLVPSNINEVNGGKIVDLVFAGLVYYDAKGVPHNDMATSIETTDAINYTVKIRSDAKFTDGTQVKAANFVKAWNYGADLANKHLGRYFFEDIEGYGTDKSVPEMSGLKVVDDTTFTVKLSKAASDFPLRLGYSAYYPLPDVAFKDIKAFGQNPIGNGPYKLANDKAWQHDVQIELVTNPDYTGPRKPKNGGVTIKFYATQDAAYADLQGGNVDVIDGIPETQLANYKNDLGDRAVNQPAAIFQSFTLPKDLAHFTGEEGKLRRKALSMAINRPQITDKIFQNTRTPASDFTSPVINGWTDKLKGAEVLKYNPEEAKKLWAEADAISPWTGKFEIAYNADGGHQAWVDAVSNSIKNTLGIDASGKAYPKFDVLRKEVTARTIKTAFRTGWQADYPGLYNFLGPLYATGASSNDSDYSNPEFEKLLAEGSVDTDPAKANEKYQQAQEILLQDLPSIPLWYANVNGGYSDKVENVQFGWNSVPLFYQITKK